MISAADVAVESEAVGGSSWGLLQDISAVAISRLLPWEYSVRNLFRRPLRTMLTLVGLTTVLLLVLVVVGFIRGLESSLEVSGDPDTAIVFALGMGENLEYSAIPRQVANLVSAGVPGIGQQYGRKYVSPEIYLGTEVTVGGRREPSLGLIRGVTTDVLMVRRGVQIEQGAWPNSREAQQPGEILVGTLAATKLGVDPSELSVGRQVQFEGRRWVVSGIFSAAGAAFESEVWCRQDELGVQMRREDLSLVAMRFGRDGTFGDLQMFCSERKDLNLQAIRETDYYALLQRDYGPIRWLAWLVVGLVAGAGVFAGLNTMYASAMGRVREWAALQTIGFSRGALLLGLVQEGVLLASAATLLATAIALIGLRSAAVRFTMGAFELAVDGPSVLLVCGIGLAMGVVGAIPPGLRALRKPIAEGLRAV